MEGNGFLGGYKEGNAGEEQETGFSALLEGGSNPFGPLTGLAVPTDMAFDGNANDHQQSFASTVGQFDTTGSSDFQNLQMPNFYNTQEINTLGATAQVGQHQGNFNVYGASTTPSSIPQAFKIEIFDNNFIDTGATTAFGNLAAAIANNPSVTPAFQPEHVDNGLFASADASHWENPASSFAHNPFSNGFTGVVANGSGQNNYRQSGTSVDPSHLPVDYNHSPYQTPRQANFSPMNMGQMPDPVSTINIRQMPGPVPATAPMHPSFYHVLVPSSEGPVRSMDTVPSDERGDPLQQGDNRFTPLDMTPSHSIPQGLSQNDPNGTSKASSKNDTNAPRERTDRKKVTQSKKKAPSTSSKTSPQTSKPLPAAEDAASEEESANEDTQPKKKTRKPRKPNIKAAIASGSLVAPSLRLANEEVIDQPYEKGAGLREPLPERKEMSLFFNNVDEARDGTAKLHWTPPQNDTSVPRSDAELIPHVIRLRDAMMDMSAYVGRPSSKMKNRWLPEDWDGKEPKEGDVLKNPYYPEHWLERRAWEIAKTCQRLHIEGPGFIDCLDPLFLEQAFEFKNLTYAERMDRLVAACRHCKDRVAAMLRIGMGAICQYILAADNLVASSKGNRANNDTRQHRLKESATKRKRKEGKEEAEKEKEGGEKVEKEVKKKKKMRKQKEQKEHE